MTSRSRYPMPLRMIALVAGLWLVLAAVLGVFAWKTLQGCGLALPDGTVLVEWCKVPSRADELAALEAEQRGLEDAITRLERQVNDTPYCGAGCLFEGEDVAVDLYLLQDLSGSFSDDLSNLVTAIDDLVARGEDGRLPAGFRLGVGSFTDKPVRPFGDPTRDYSFRSAVSVTDDLPKVSEAVRAFTIDSGGNTAEESQFEAMIEVLGAMDDMGFRPDARKFLVIVTDAPAHVEGDWEDAPAQEDGVADGDGLNEDYPSRAIVKERLAATNVTPIFLVASGAAQTFYRQFTEDTGSGVVIPITSDSSGLLDALFEGIFGTCVGA
ncbi:hypothetical protein [Caenispirillum salinarum]|uniref:hypothetical protein n=1 Tax=Caenispirillum salinarum TaxID=859058 RepID=UPI0038500D30